jgi:hypothetical protein
VTVVVVVVVRVCGGGGGVTGEVHGCDLNEAVSLQMDNVVRDSWVRVTNSTWINRGHDNHKRPTCSCDIVPPERCCACVWLCCSSVIGETVNVCVFVCVFVCVCVYTRDTPRPPLSPTAR